LLGLRGGGGCPAAGMGRVDRWLPSCSPPNPACMHGHRSRHQKSHSGTVPTSDFRPNQGGSTNPKGATSLPSGPCAWWVSAPTSCKQWSVLKADLLVVVSAVHTKPHALIAAITVLPTMALEVGGGYLLGLRGGGGCPAAGMGRVDRWLPSCSPPNPACMHGHRSRHQKSHSGSVPTSDFRPNQGGSTNPKGATSLPSGPCAWWVSAPTSCKQWSVLKADLLVVVSTISY
jgi:hypothetical protein